MSASIRLSFIAVVGSLVAAAGCYGPTEPNCSFRCDTARVCPDDYECRMDGYCHLKGSGQMTCFANTSDGTVVADLTGLVDAGGDAVVKPADAQPDTLVVSMDALPDVLVATDDAADAMMTADLPPPDLTGPDLSGPDLTSTADLFVPDLSTPDLTVVDLSAPDLTVADLTPGPDLTPIQDLTPGPDMSHCGNGTKDADETDTDCGGAMCQKCANAKMCTAGSDCTSNACAGGICKAASMTIMVGPGGALMFSPSTATISAGQTVLWVWAFSGHTVVSGSGCTADNQFCDPADSNCSNAPTLSTGATYAHTFSSAGSFPYFCRPHCGAGMTGTITVQ